MRKDATNAGDSGLEMADLQLVMCGECEVVGIRFTHTIPELPFSIFFCVSNTLPVR